MVRILEELGIYSKEKIGIHAVVPIASNLRCRIVQGIEVIKHEIERPVIDVLPFILAAAKRSSNLRNSLVEGTHDEYDVRVARLHLGCRRCVFIAGKILRVHNGNDRV